MSQHRNAFHITGPLNGKIHQSPVNSPHKVLLMQSFDVLFVAIVIKLLNKWLGCHWFEMSCDISAKLCYVIIKQNETKLSVHKS